MVDVNLNLKLFLLILIEVMNWFDKKFLFLNLNIMLSKILFILVDNKYNFNKYGYGFIDSLGVFYDYGLIMYYGKWEFV